MKKLIFIDGGKRSGKTYLAYSLSNSLFAPVIQDYFHLHISSNLKVQNGGISALSKEEKHRIALNSMFDQIHSILASPSDLLLIDRSFLGYQYILDISNPYNPFYKEKTFLLLIEQPGIEASKEKRYVNYISKGSYLFNKTATVNKKEDITLDLVKAMLDG